MRLHGIQTMADINCRRVRAWRLENAGLEAGEIAAGIAKGVRYHFLVFHLSV
jgi:hypothetical protein